MLTQNNNGYIISVTHSGRLEISMKKVIISLILIAGFNSVWASEKLGITVGMEYFYTESSAPRIYSYIKPFINYDNTFFDNRFIINGEIGYRHVLSEMGQWDDTRAWFIDWGIGYNWFISNSTITFMIENERVHSRTFINTSSSHFTPSVKLNQRVSFGDLYLQVGYRIPSTGFRPAGSFHDIPAYIGWISNFGLELELFHMLFLREGSGWANQYEFQVYYNWNNFRFGLALKGSASYHDVELEIHIGYTFRNRLTAYLELGAGEASGPFQSTVSYFHTVLGIKYHF